MRKAVVVLITALIVPVGAFGYNIFVNPIDKMVALDKKVGEMKKKQKENDQGVSGTGGKQNVEQELLAVKVNGVVFIGNKAFVQMKTKEGELKLVPVGGSLDGVQVLSADFNQVVLKYKGKVIKISLER